MTVVTFTDGFHINYWMEKIWKFSLYYGLWTQSLLLVLLSWGDVNSMNMYKYFTTYNGFKFDVQWRIKSFNYLSFVNDFSPDDTMDFLLRLLLSSTSFGRLNVKMFDDKNEQYNSVFIFCSDYRICTHKLSIEWGWCLQVFQNSLIFIRKFATLELNA